VAARILPLFNRDFFAILSSKLEHDFFQAHCDVWEYDPSVVIKKFQASTASAMQAIGRRENSRVHVVFDHHQ